MREGLKIAQKSIHENSNSRDKSLLAICYNSIGDVLAQTGKSTEAREAYRTALSILQKLVDAQPTVLAYQTEVARCQNNIGRLQVRQKQFTDAFIAFDAALTIRQKLIKHDPYSVYYTSELADSLAARGQARVRAGQPAEAAADIRQALELWAKLPNLDMEILERSRALALLAGLGGDAKSGVTKEEAKTFADQSVTDLAAAVEIGWAFPSELKEPDFDALRGRADFQKLVAESEAKAKK
jgi:tetratricopeptide (TPR) repeat protein